MPINAARQQLSTYETWAKLRRVIRCNSLVGFWAFHLQSAVGTTNSSRRSIGGSLSIRPFQNRRTVTHVDAVQT